MVDAGRVIAIFGPTGVGKTSVAVEVAERLGVSVISCDSMQLYRGFPVLTNQPRLQETRGVKHELVAVADPQEEWTAVEYGRPLLLRIGNCDQFMLYAAGLLEPGLVSQDGETLIELHGVAGNNRDPEALRHFHGHRGLPHPRRSEDGDNPTGVHHGHAPSSSWRWPR